MPSKGLEISLRGGVHSPIKTSSPSRGYSEAGLLSLSPPQGDTKAFLSAAGLRSDVIRGFGHVGAGRLLFGITEVPKAELTGQMERATGAERMVLGAKTSRVGSEPEGSRDAAVWCLEKTAYPQAPLPQMQADPQQPTFQQKDLLLPGDRLSPAARHGSYTDDNRWFLRSSPQPCGLFFFVLECWGSLVTGQVHEGCDLMSQKCSVWAVTE